MILLQVPPGTQELLTGAQDITPYSEKVFGYIILILVVGNLAQAMVVVYLYRAKEKLHDRMADNGIAQTEVFGKLAIYMEQSADHWQTLNESITSRTTELTRVIKRVGFKIQKNEAIDPD
jgi:hypothetical protein